MSPNERRITRRGADLLNEVGEMLERARKGELTPEDEQKYVRDCQAQATVLAAMADA